MDDDYCPALLLAAIIIKFMIANLTSVVWRISIDPWEVDTPTFMDIDEKKNDTCHICTLNRLMMILADGKVW